ncbi:MAG: bifunctional metallophosphatase/5'-nucleotidase [Bryobacteraceae bacterium]
MWQSLLVLLLFFTSPLFAAERATVTILATTDLHGNIMPYDYFTGKPANRGLAKIATLINRVRAENPNTLVIDCGDTIQGTPLEYVYQTFVRTSKPPLGLEAPPGLSADPMMRVMNHLKFDAMVLGNHEFNFGLKNLDRARADARFPWLSANTQGGKEFLRYTIKRSGRIRVAIVGVTTPGVPTWEKPENYAGYRFIPMAEAVKDTLSELQHQEQDVVVVAAHSGLDRDLKTGERFRALPGENDIYGIAQVPGVDAIIFGHTHRELPHASINGVLLNQPRNWGMSLGRVDLTLEKVEHGWKVVEKTSTTIPVTDDVPADPEIVEIARPYHELAERYLGAVIAEARESVDSSAGRVRDSALVDAIHEVQMHYAQADVSFAALFNPRVRVPKGPVTVRQIAALYLYENELYAVEGTGQLVKDVLEYSSGYYLQCPDAVCSQGPLINRKIIGYNYEMAQGVDYEIDLTQPPGSRIRNLRFKGEPLAMDRKLRIAVNNYRAGGSGGYSMFRGAKIVWRSNEDIRQLIIDYFTAKKTLPAKPDGNWRVVPESAQRLLDAEANREASRSLTQ